MNSLSAPGIGLAAMYANISPPTSSPLSGSCIQRGSSLWVSRFTTRTIPGKALAPPTAGSASIAASNCSIAAITLGSLIPPLASVRAATCSSSEPGKRWLIALVERL